MRTLISILVANALFMSGASLAADSDVQKIAELEKQLAEITDDLDYLNSRVDKTERHSALDRLEITGDFRTSYIPSQTCRRVREFACPHTRHTHLLCRYRRFELAP